MQTYPARSRLRSRHAFTLIELLTVIAIIGILAAIIIPTISKVRQTARKAQCVARMRQWGNAVLLSVNDAKNKVALGYVKDINDSSIYIFDAYFNSGGGTEIEESSGKVTFNKSATKKFWGCPTNINGGNTLTASQYAFVAPLGYSNKTIVMLGGSVSRSYSISDAASPSKLLLMIEVKNGSNSLDINTAGDIATILNGGTSTRPMQTEDGYVRHGGTANALFLDGHVSGLSLTETDYSIPESKLTMDRYFSLK
jgi:prepilin-type N-terminal cleavage/methylation domain-containing protein/prepilin-type processing-associated H-X9-DG protein